MSLRLSIDDPHSPGEASNWIMKIDESTTVGEAAESLGVAASLFTLDGDKSAKLTELGVLSGAVLPSPPVDGLPAGTPRLEVVGGPFAGSAFALAPGEAVTIGNSPEASIAVADPYLAPMHARLIFAPEGAAAGLTANVVAAKGAQVIVNGDLITGETRVVPADVIQIGSSMFRLGLAPAADADLSVDEPGLRGFNRPSRIEPAQPTPKVVLPGDKPDDPDKTPLPWLSALIPVVLGITMAVLFGRVIMLLMAVASPVMVLGSFFTNRKLAKRKGEKTDREWVADIRAAEERIAQLVREQRLDGWYRHPDPVVIRDIATRPLSRLWERRMTDDDARHVRLGVTEVPLRVDFEGGSSKQRGSDRTVRVCPEPVAVDLADGVVGIAGPSDAVHASARWILTSLATLRSPRDLQLMVLCDNESEFEWSFAQWLPHMHPSEHLVATFGNTEDTRRERLRDAVMVLEARMRAGERAKFDSELLIIVDGARKFRMLPGLVPLLEHGPKYGINIIALDSDRARLPEECASVVIVDTGDPSLARLETGQDYFSTVLLDGISLPHAEAIARSMCSVLHVSGFGDEGMLPQSVRYVDLLRVDLDDPSPVVERWAASPRNTFVTIGAGPEGEFALDLAADGPHALVAGTTGSGKSEFLQAWVIALAMANRPDALNFVLIDYKGGSAFADCERLPHTVGMVTNLDARETERALASLDAELKRRERVLRDMGAKDGDAAWAKDPEAAARHGLARLVIVIDEFAELKTELPEFINGLVRIARVGRSLGVHLILATQRPSGVVTPEMQSNIALRVALRVTDRGDSNDILGSGEAALISATTPGRGFARFGPGAAPALFQTARVAGHRQGIQRAEKLLPPRAEVEWNALGMPPKFPSTGGQKQVITDHDDTDLRALVNLVQAATTEMGLQRNPSPWLLPLPDVLPLSQFADEQIAATELVIGLEDVPSEQAQRTRVWNVEHDSHLLFFGGARSGRTTALRTLLAQAVQRFTPADLHLYVADYGNGALLPFADAPHCGAVVTQLDTDRLPRLMSRMLEELSTRQNVLSKLGVGSIAEQRARSEQKDQLPFVIFAIDGWERLASTMNPDQLVIFRDHFMRVLREGPSVGVRTLLAADRGVPGDKIAGFIDDQLVLPLRDINDYRSAGIVARDIPTNLPSGRAMLAPDADEVQVAVVTRDTSGEGQTSTLRSIVEHVRDHFDRFPELLELPRPFRVDPLPKYASLTDAMRLPLADGQPNGPVVGVGGDSLARFTLDWPVDSGFVVYGARGTGRSSTLALIARQLADRGDPVMVIAPRRSLLTDAADAADLAVVRDTAMMPTDFVALFNEVAGDDRTPVTVIVDDADRMKGSTVEHALTGVMTRAVFIVAVDSEGSNTTFGGALAAAKRARRALILSPETPMVGTQAAGVPVPKFLLGSMGEGGGVLLTGHGWLAVRVPDVRQ